MRISKFNTAHDKGYFVHVTKMEALSLIRSLTNQLVEGNPNSGRLESYTDKGEYFSIGVLNENSNSKSKTKKG